jgi:hypothetical protein
MLDVTVAYLEADCDRIIPFISCYNISYHKTRCPYLCRESSNTTVIQGFKICPNVTVKHISTTCHRPDLPGSKSLIPICCNVSSPCVLHVAIQNFFTLAIHLTDRFCGLVVRVLGYRSGGPDSIPGTAKKKVVGLERGPLSLVSTTEELLDRKVAVPV